MLLGSSEKLPYRRKVKRKLLKMGFNKIIIMEELERNLDDGSLDEQFESIVAKLKLDVFFAIFHKNAKNVNGVVFEIGWLCGKFGSRIIGDKLKFIFENKYDFNKEGTSAYIQALFNKITRVEFDDSIEYSTCWEIIRTYTPMLKNRR
jgi:hypothetical protein